MMASTATSVCVFLPIILFEGLAKEVFKSIAFSMMFALSASIIVAMLWVPMASSLFLDVKKISDNAEKAAKFNAFRDKYKELVAKVLENRWKMVIGVTITFVIVVFGIGKTVKTTFFPTIDDNQYSVVATLATGLDLDVSKDIANKMEERYDEGNEPCQRKIKRFTKCNTCGFTTKSRRSFIAEGLFVSNRR